MKSLIATALFGSALALSAMASSPGQPEPEKKTDVKKAEVGTVPLEGGYTIVSAERDGKAIPEVETKELVVRFTRHEMLGTGKNRKSLYGAEYKLDTTKTPWKIDMKTTPPEKPFLTREVLKEPVTATGLVKKEGGTITLIYALPGGEAPTEFKTKAKQQMLVMKSFIGDDVMPNKFPEEP